MKRKLVLNATVKRRLLLQYSRYPDIREPLVSLQVTVIVYDKYMPAASHPTIIVCSVTICFSSRLTSNSIDVRDEQRRNNIQYAH